MFAWHQANLIPPPHIFHFRVFNFSVFQYVICPFEENSIIWESSSLHRSRKKKIRHTNKVFELPIFVSLLKQSEEEYGFQSNGGLVLPCEVVFFKRVLKLLDKDENRFRRLELDEFLNLFSDTVDPNYRREGTKDFGFTPLLPKTRA
ncbi:hypothetical protein MKW92_030943 [Papaver armeniacum]|nr:hypothetical protein MKW92_030943 [Papaver armeniacum]